MTTEIDERDGEQEPQTGRWKKKLGLGFAGLLILLILAYFVVTSSGFVKGVILPRVGKSMNSDLKVESLSLSPFSGLHITGLKFQPNGQEPLITAAEARVRYSLIDIMRGTIRVNELTLVSPTITLIKNPDGSSNLDPITQTSPKQNEPQREPKKMRFAIKNVALKNASVRIVEKLKDGGIKTTELANLNLTLDQLVTGAPGKLTLASDFSVLNSGPKVAANDVLKGGIKGGFEVALDANLKPTRLNGSVTLKLAQTAGAYTDFNGFSTTLDADVSPAEIRQAVVRFARNDQDLGELRVSGPFDMNTMEGRLTQVFSIDQRMLNLAGAARGLDFRNSSIRSTNVIDLSKKGTSIAISGNITGRSITLAKQSQQTPTLNLDADYQLVVNRADESALFQKLNLNATQNGQDLLRTVLNRPMTLSWGSSVPGFTESALKIVLTNFDIGQWSILTGTNAPSGVASAMLDLLAQQDGRALTAAIAAEADNLGMRLGTNSLQNTQVHLDASGNVENLRLVNITKFSISARQNKGTLFQSDGSLRYDLKTKDLRGQLSVGAEIATVIGQFPVAQFSATQGEAKFSLNFSVDSGKTTALGNLSFENLTGKYEPYVLNKLQTALDYNLEMRDKLVQIHDAALSFSQGFSKGGSADLKGTFDLAKKTANLEFKTVDLNQNILTSFLAPSLGENKLVSISLNSDGSVAYDPNGDSSIKANLSIDNWVVQDPAKKLPSEPLSAKLQLDTGMNKQLIDLRQVLLKLRPTDRAKNELSIKGRIDLAKTNAAPGTLAIQSDSLDVTPYYDLFAGKQDPATAVAEKKKEKKPAAAVSTGPMKDPNKEPEPITLPFQDFTATLNIGQFYLRQITASNLTGVAKINQGELRINPLQVALNGAPFSADILLNLGVPGYSYDISYNADRVPLEPIVNSLSAQSTGQMKGFLVSSAKLKGAGVTGVNLQKNLNGSASFSVTNMNVQVVSPKWRNVLEPIALVLNLPELTETPLDWLAGQIEISAGKINLREFTVESAAFMANSQGTIPIEPILTNSPLNLPLSLSISRSLAQKARVPISDSGGDTNYVKLPDFVTVNGTLGKPGTKINKFAIAGMIAQSAGFTDKALKALPSGAGNVLQDVLGAGTANKAAAGQINAAASTNSVAGNLLRDLSGTLDARRTNKSSANTNGAPVENKKSKPNALDLLKSFEK